MKQTLNPATALLLMAATALVSVPGQAGPVPVGGDGARIAPAVDQLQQHQVYDINLHDPEELVQLLHRLDELAGTPNAASHAPRIALVLHGPEIEFFAIEWYEHYRELVDMAARLDAFRVIEVKACETRMQELGLTEEDLPGFIETVPYGPAEIKRLERQGYVRM